MSPSPPNHLQTSCSPPSTSLGPISSPELLVPQKLPSRATSPTQYAFIMQSGDESTATAKQKLKTVRSHVMKNYLHQQQQGSVAGESSLNSAQGERRRSKQRLRNSRSGSHETDFSASLALTTTGRSRSSSASTEVGSMFSGFTMTMPYSGDDYTSQAESVGAGQGHRFALDFNFVAPADEVSAFAQLYANSVALDKKSGLYQPSFETLNAKGETMRIVQDTIAVCGSNVPQSIIFAVALLAFGCGEDQEWDEARGHVEALQRLTDMRGGVQTLDFELQRTLTWATYSLSAALRLPPRFLLPIFSDVKAFPLAFHDDAQIRAWRTMKRFPKNTSFVFDIVVRFHQLGLAISSEWYNEVDQRTLSNLYFEAIHSAIVVQLDEPWIENLPRGFQGQEAVTMFKIWTAGLPLFVWATARHVRGRQDRLVPRPRYNPIFSRIKALLDSGGGYHVWPRGKSLEPILATLVYSFEACEFGDPWRAWCVDTLRKVAEMLKLKSVEEFRKILEFFPLTDEHRTTLGELWSEMMYGSVSSTPSLTFSTIQ